jgi:hypothetical protein
MSVRPSQIRATSHPGPKLNRVAGDADATPESQAGDATAIPADEGKCLAGFGA